MCAETDLQPAKTTKKALPHLEDQMAAHHYDMIASKSLLEEEEEDDDDEDETLSRNPSIEEMGQDMDDARAGHSEFSRLGDDHEYTNDEWANFGGLNICQGEFPVIPACQMQLAQQVEMFTQWRHPMEFLSLFNEETDREGVEVFMPPGMYKIPKTCEYCGSHSTDLCSGECQRPRSFYRKQRPPFCAPGPQWEELTDYATIIIKKKPRKAVVEEEEDDKEAPKTAKSFSMLSGLFGRPGL